MSNFSNLLDQYREERGISKKQLADKSGLSAGYVSLLISGGRGSPSAEAVDALARALSLGQEEKEKLLQAAKLDLPVVTPLSLADTDIDPRAAGIVSVHPDFPDDLFEKRIAEAKELVRIHTTWLPDPRRYKRAFLRASERNVPIQVLLLEPDSPHAIQRARDLDPTRNEHFVSQHIESNLHDFERLFYEGVKVEVRVYNSLPSIEQYTCDDHTFIGFFIHGERSDLAPQLEIAGRDTVLSRFIKEEFDRVWRDAHRRVPDENNKPVK
jgi:transcriptional regulator with XRE-family HTH domain